jgi:hypothetical protein
MKTNYETTVDALGAVKAEMAALAEREKALKAALIEMGDGEYDGVMFRATVSTAERRTLDMKAVREKLSPQFIAAHTNVAEVTTVRVVARNGRRRNWRFSRRGVRPRRGGRDSGSRRQSLPKHSDEASLTPRSGMKPERSCGAIISDNPNK